MPTRSDYQTTPTPKPGRRYFTVEQANRALPYVGRIVQDIRQTYRRAVKLQLRLERPVPGDDAEELQASYDRDVELLNRYAAELQDVGVELKDYEVGLIDFPALHEGREVYLCWKCGERRVQAWHEVDAGYAGRQDIATLKPHDPK